MRATKLLAAAAVISAFACTKADKTGADSLSLATQNQATLDSISAAERAKATVTPAPGYATTTTTTTQRTPTSINRKAARQARPNGVSPYAARWVAEARLTSKAAS